MYRLDNNGTHELERTVLGLRVTFLRVLASVKSMAGSHRLYRVGNKLTLQVKMPAPQTAWFRVVLSNSNANHGSHVSTFAYVLTFTTRNEDMARNTVVFG